MIQSTVGDHNPFLTGTALRQQLFNYIPRQLLEDVNTSKLGLNSSEILSDNGVKILQKLLKNSSGQLRMHGTAKEFAAKLEKHRQFTSSHKLFGMDILEPYNRSVETYPSNNGKSIICKQDFFVILHSKILKKFPDMKTLPRSILAIFLKTHEERLNGCLEFIRRDSEIFDKIDNQIKDEMEELKNNLTWQTDELEKYRISNPNATFKTIFKQWKAIVPGLTVGEYEPVQRALRIHCDNYPPEIFPKIYAEVFFCTKTIIEMLRSIMLRHPAMFISKPAARTTYKIEKPNFTFFPNLPYTVRVFHNHMFQRIVMNAELYEVINAINALYYPNNDPLKCNDNEIFLFAMGDNEFKCKFARQLCKIEFVNVPLYTPIIENGKKFGRLHLLPNTSPIMTPTGDYCIPSIDVFNETLRQSIFARKIFQKVKYGNTSQLLKDYVKILGKYFTADFKRGTDGRYFISLFGVKKLEKELDEFCKQFKNEPAHDVSNTEKDGFTLDDLIYEVKYLGLNDVFPDIIIDAEKAYNDLSRREENKKLTTSDFFDTIEALQKAAFLKMFPEINDFLHTQWVAHTDCNLCLSGLIRNNQLQNAELNVYLPY